jgi:hypothetical protein
MKRFMPAFLFVLLFAAIPLQAQVRWGVRLGVVGGGPMIGGDLVLAMGGGFIFNPGVEISHKLISTNADVHYDIEIHRDAAFWVGSGIAVLHPEDRDLDVGVNLIAGVGTRRSGHIIYTQLKMTASAGSENYTTLAVGIRF